jgi:hypothetical protein
MYKLLIAVMIVLIADLLHAQNNTINILADVNAGWLKQPEAKQLQQVQLTGATNYQQCIATHLKLVEQILRQRDVIYLSSAQKQNRTHLLDELNGYWKAGVFPVNDYLPYKSPVFIDRKGTHCAVGYLMMQSGYDDLAQHIDHNEKFAYVHEIKTAGVAAWANKYGFTIDELAWIQPQYFPETQFLQLENGTNGPVNYFATNYNQLFFAGAFDTLKNMPCKNIGGYTNGSFQCMGSGIEGEIKTINYRNNYATASGSLQVAGHTYPLAYFTGLWNFVDIPGREGASATYSLVASGEYKYQIAITHPSNPGVEEIWYETNNGVWEQKAIVYGVVLDMKGGGYRNIYAGAFDSVTIFGETDTNTVIAHNVIMSERVDTSLVWYGIGNELSDTVRVIKSIGGAIYFGGSCSSDSGRSNICLTRYLHGVLQPVYRNDTWPTMPVTVNAVEEYDDRLIIGGHFQYDGMMLCKNLISYNAISGSGGAFGYLNGDVNALARFNGELYIAGDFTTNNYSQSLKYLAKVGVATGISQIGDVLNFTVYPNPADKYLTINISADQPFKQIVISDITGRELIKHAGNDLSNTVLVEDLLPGVYVIRVLTANGTGNARFVKQ